MSLCNFTYGAPLYSNNHCFAIMFYIVYGYFRNIPWERYSILSNTSICVRFMLRPSSSLSLNRLIGTLVVSSLNAPDANKSRWCSLYGTLTLLLFFISAHASVYSNNTATKYSAFYPKVNVGMRVLGNTDWYWMSLRNYPCCQNFNSPFCIIILHSVKVPRYNIQ